MLNTVETLSYNKEKRYNKEDAYSITLETPPWGLENLWLEASQTIEHLIRYHRHHLNPTKNLAAEILSELEILFPCLDDLCIFTCPMCPDPCCLTAKIWFDFKDLLFLHLSDQEIPPSQALEHLNMNCRYHNFNGCSLPRKSRPWVCTLYLCPPQLVHFRRKPSTEQKILNQSIQTIKKLRKEMENEFIRVISP